MSKISIKNLDLYYGDFKALKDVNLEIEANKITAFIGPSGCGKSTLLKSINRMNDLVEGCRIEGEILLDGQNITGKHTIDINHAGTRLLAMSKPVYSTLTALSGGHAALVFVPSRKQAQMTAIDILTFVSATSKPRRFNHIPQDQMDEVLSRVVDPALKTVLAAGVAFFYKVETWKRSER